MTTSKPVLAFCLMLISSALATPDSVDVPSLPEPVPGPTVAAGETLTLNLAAAYELALTRNLNLQVGRYDLAVAGTGILAQTGIFDPNFSFGVTGSYSKSPTVTELEGAPVTESRTTDFGLGLSQLLPIGTQLNLEAGTRRTENNSQFYFLNPNWGSDLALTVRQPLLKGFGTLVNRSGLLIARNSHEQTGAAFELMVVSTLGQVENAYWDLVASREEVAVKEQSLALAQRLLSETRQRVEVGTSAPIDLVQSEAGVASRLQELIWARNAASNAEDALKALLGFDQPAEWTTRIETSEPYAVEAASTDLAGAITTALEGRTEIEQKQLDLAYRALNVELARNAVMPQLNLDGSYGYRGIGGEGESGGIAINGGFSDSARQIRDMDYPHWTLGMSVALPLGNHDAKSILAQRRFELERSRVSLDALRQQIVHEVRQAVRAMDDGAAAIEAAVASRQFAQRNLEAEQTKFANGLSTNYQVLQIQEDLAVAQLAELNARISYRKAMAGYRVATGTLLQFAGVTIADPTAPEPAHDYWGDVKWLRFVDLRQALRKDKPAADEEGD